MQFPYDGQLASAIANDAGSMDEVVRRLERIDGILDGSRDGLKWFNSVYLEVTLAVQQRVANNDFAEPEGTAFIANLDFVFANLYFAALRTWLAGGNPPESWRLVFEQRANWALARIQFALAGVNAHINRDLAVAITQTSSHPSAVQYAAYTALNTTLDSLVERAKKELMVSLPGDALPGARQVEFAAAAWSVAAARESAWVHGEILSAIAGQTPLARRFIDSLDSAATLAGKALLISV